MGVGISVWNTANKFEAAAITAINYMSVDAPCQQFSAGSSGAIADYNDNHVDLSDWGILAQQPEPHAQGGERDAGDREQESNSDRKGVRIIAGILRPASYDEATRAAERDREHHQGTDREGEPGMAPAETT